MRSIKIYTTTQCSDCRAAKRFLAEQLISYEEINIEEDFAAAEVVAQMNEGKRSVPTFDIDGKFFSCSPFSRKRLSTALGLAELKQS